MTADQKQHDQSGGAPAADERLAALRAEATEIESARRELEERAAGVYAALLEAGDDAVFGDASDPEAALRRQAAEAEGKYKRALADFQNYRRRAVENEAEAKRQGASRVIEALLTVLDNFRLALDVDPATSSAEQVIQGVGFIRDEMVRTLRGIGLEEITPPAAEPFDADRHEALMQQPSVEVAAGSVLSVVSPGYALSGRVLRPAKVIVSQGAGGDGPGEDGSSDDAGGE